MTPEAALHELVRNLDAMVASHRIVFELGLLDEREDLLDEEIAVTAGWAERRRAEFRMGRACARRALRRLGAPAGPVLIGPGGEPLWPAGTAGSLSHKDWACIVALGSRATVLSVGVDLEVMHGTGEFAAEVCTSAEIRRLSDLARVTRSPLDAMVVAKEAFYKCQFPVSGRELSWHDVEVVIDHMPAFQVITADPHERPVVGFLVESAPWIAAICVALPSALGAIGEARPGTV